MIDFLIAAVLYAVTYLSFVRLLKYPRNWHLPTLSTSLATIGLATVTVAHVSSSAEGVDLLAAVVSAGFIAGLFGIISAPAVDLRPGAPRPIVEFLAKHGDYAGLWIILPAIVAGYALPDAKLFGVLAAALIIELTWFLRHRWTGVRRQYPLSGHDLAVLKAQAKGNIEDFARRHGIRELVLSSDGTIGWLGCGKETLPCPLNYYVHRLGLNTAPCCREHLKALCYYVASCLRDMGAVHWLDGGNLLGAVRESGTLLAWEDDIDIAVLLDRDTTWDSLKASFSERVTRDGYYVDVFENKKYITISYDPPGSWPFRWERNRMRGEIRLDLCVHWHAVSYGQSVLERRTPKGAMPLTQAGCYGVPQEIVLPVSTIAFLGDDFACPNQSEAYLRFLYGDFEEIVLTYVDAARVDTRRIADTAVKSQPK